MPGSYGPVSDDELFYPMSRGIPEKEAERLIVFGFFAEVLDRVELPRIPIPTDTATWAGIVTGVALLLLTLLGAMLGGRVGRRYHDKVDRAALP